ncbi:unnamed protein product [Peronospora effusa]|nr:unnamed protein product [Peronospora effusa]
MALRTIAVGEELVVDKGSVAPDGSRRQTASKFKTEMSFSFDLNEDAVLGALRYSSKNKFVNHGRNTPNCTAMAVSICGVHHITVWALHTVSTTATCGVLVRLEFVTSGGVGLDGSQRQRRLRKSDKARVLTRTYRSSTLESTVCL